MGCLALAGGAVALGLGAGTASAQGGDSTSTTLSASPNPVAYAGDTVLQATVTDTTQDAVPTGTVDFTVAVGSGSDYACEGVDLTASGPDSAVASCTWNYQSWNQTFQATSAKVGGTFSVTATYQPSGEFEGSSGPASVSVLGAHVATATLALSPNPDPQSSGVAGQVTASMTMTSVANPPVGSPTGTVTAVDQSSDTTLCEAPLPAYSSSAATASASCTFVPSELGAVVPIELVYSGDDEFVARTTVQKLVVTGDATPTLSVTPKALTHEVGQSLQLVGHVPVPVTGAPPTWASLTVSPPSGSPFACGTKAHPVEIPVSATGTVSCKFTPTLAGSYSVTESYSGNQDYLPSTSGPLSFTVAGSTYASWVSLATSVSPAPYDTAVTIAATAHSTGPTPTGSIIFTDGATGQALACSQGSGGVVPLTSAEASCTFTPPVAGNEGTDFPVVAYYSGDDSNTPAKATFTQPVNGNNALASLTVTASPATGATKRTPITFQASAAGGSGNPVPTGSVIFKLTGTSTHKTSVKLLGGSASWTYKFPDGSYTMTVAYSGDTTYAAVPLDATGYANSVHFTVSG